jgi:glutamate--LysW ligase ArgX
VVRVDVKKRPLRYGGQGAAEAAVIRPVSMYRAAYSAGAYEASRVFTVNTAETIMLSGDKALTYARLASRGIPIPPTLYAATPEAAAEAAEETGYPVVVKPAVGSWGRLVARASSREKLEQLAALRQALPCAPQKTMLIQPLVDTGGSDIRCIVVAGELLGCMKRTASRSGEWRSNVALGARVEPLRPSSEIEDLAARAADAVNGYFVSIDIFETPEGPLVNEVNGVPEFKGFIRATGVDPAEALSAALRSTLHR